MQYLNIRLSLNRIERIKEMSSYNDNYYKVFYKSVSTDNDNLPEVCYEDDCFKFELRHIENGKFKAALSWIDYNPDGVDGLIGDL